MHTTDIKTAELKRQRYLGQKGLVLLLALLSAAIPLSNDMYLPALPGMVQHFQAPVNIINLTLIMFIFSYGFGMLICGPLSDKYGRKPVLLMGLTLYTLASFFCAISGNIYHLIIFRIFQALGGSTASTISMAVVKDVYTGRKREFILSLVQSMVMISLALAPIIGAIILKVSSWQGIFWTLTGIGALALLLCAVMEETIDIRYTGTIMQSMGRLAFVLKNPGFASLVVIFAILSMPFMAFLASSSYIYVNGFGLNEQGYSYYFGLNAVFLMMGPIFYIILSKRLSRNIIIMICFLSVAAGGLLICTLGTLKPWIFALSLMPATFGGSIVRPPSTNLMLEQQQQDTGSASSLIGCSTMLLGSISMLLISLGWSNTIIALGVMHIIAGLTAAGIWLPVHKKPFIKQLPSALSSRPTA